MNWDDLKVFLAIAQTKGLKKAALKLGLHHTSCARRIKKLETDLGVQLFDRLAEGYVLTASGEELFQSASQIQDEFSAIEGAMIGKDARLEGKLCVTIPNGLAVNLLMPDLAKFMELYPDVEMDINMSYTMRDLAAREADVAIRIQNHPPESLAGRRVGRIHLSAYASRQYLRTHDPRRFPQQCHWLGWGNPADHLKWAEKNNYPEIPVKGNLYSDIVQLSALQSHAGIASLACYLADPLPDLQRLNGAQVVPGEWIWLLAHKNMQTNLKVRTFINFMEEAFKRHSPLLAGKLAV